MELLKLTERDLTGVRNVPSGVVTFLLTDIVGSTMQWDRSPSSMSFALDRHDEIIESVITGSGGYFLKFRGEGDATFSVFHRASDALSAAVKAQQAISSESWPEQSRIFVRMSVHTGEAIERGGDYYGGTVNRAARLRGLAGPGEILVSQATHDLAIETLPTDVRLLDQGIRVLRDLSRPERVFAVAAAGVALPPESDRPSAAHSAEAAHLVVALPHQLRDRSPFGFVGRAEETTRLSGFLDQPSSESILALISGEPGAGKTELVGQVCRSRVAKCELVVYGRCDESIRSAFQPWAEALRSLIVGLAPGAIDADLQRLSPELGMVLPDIARRWPTMSRVVGRDPESERYLFFRAVTDLLKAVSSRTPIIVVLDDIHWADGSTLGLLRYLIANAADLNVKIIVTERPFEGSESPTFNAFLAETRRETNVLRVDVAGLSAEEVSILTVLVAENAAEEKVASFSKELFSHTEGNAFFVNEVLRRVTIDSGVGSGLHLMAGEDFVHGVLKSDGVREVVQQRVSKLGPDAVRVLEMASVVGLEFDLHTVAQALDTAEDSVLDHLERAMTAGLLIEEMPGQFSFLHRIVARLTYETIRPTRRSLMHGRVASALEILCADELDRAAGTIAHHRSFGQGPKEQRLALTWMKRAARHSLSALAFEDGAAWWRKTIAVGEEVGIDDAEQCALMVELGDAQRLAGEGGFRETLLEAAELAVAIGRDDLLVRAAIANNRGYQSNSSSIDAERVAILEVAIARTEGQLSGERALLLALLGNELCYGGDYERRVALSDAAVALAREVGDPAVLARVLQQRHLAVNPLQISNRATISDEACDLAETVGDPVLRFWTAVVACCSYVDIFDLRKAAFHQTRFRSIAERLRQPLHAWVAAWISVPLLVLQGNTEEAEERVALGLRLGTECGQADAASVYAGGMVGIRWDQGRLAELEPAFAQVDAAFDPSKALPTSMVAYRCLRASGFAEAGRIDDAVMLLDSLTGRLTGVKIDPIWTVAMAAAADAAVRVNHTDLAAELFPLLTPFGGALGSNAAASFGSIDCHLGGLAMVLGDWASARRYLDAAVSRAEEMVAPGELRRATHVMRRLADRRAGSANGSYVDAK